MEAQGKKMSQSVASNVRNSKEKREGKGEMGSGRRTEGKGKMEEEFNQCVYFHYFRFLAPLKPFFRQFIITYVEKINVG